MTGKDTKAFVEIPAAFGTAISTVGAAPAVADPNPWGGRNLTPPTPACKTTALTSAGVVPGMNRAKVGDSYTDTEYFIFATSPTGETLACRGKPAHYVRTLAGHGSLNFGPAYKGVSLNRRCHGCGGVYAMQTSQLARAAAKSKGNSNRVRIGHRKAPWRFSSVTRSPIVGCATDPDDRRHQCR